MTPAEITITVERSSVFAIALKVGFGLTVGVALGLVVVASVGLLFGLIGLEILG